MDVVYFAERGIGGFRARRLRLHITQKRVTTALGHSRQWLALRETGMCATRVEDLAALHGVLDRIERGVANEA